MNRIAAPEKSAAETSQIDAGQHGPRHVRIEDVGRTERLLLLENANDDAELDGEVEGGGGGGPDDGKDKEPVVVKLAGRVRLEVVGDSQASVEGDVTRADEEDDNSGWGNRSTDCQTRRDQ